MSQNQFDFKAYNAITNTAGSGLKLHLSIQMLENVASTLYRFKNPHLGTLEGIVSELKEVQTLLKAEAARRTKE